MIGFPKPTRAERLGGRVGQKRESDRQGSAVKGEVWKRDASHCRCCGRFVLRTLEMVPNRGECHHIIHRAVRVLRYDPRNLILLCLECHIDVTRYVVRIIGRRFFRVPELVIPCINADYPVEFKKAA